MTVFAKAVSCLAAVLVLSIPCDGCFDSYLICIQEYSLGISTLTLEETPDAHAMCGVMSKAIVCIDADRADCPEEAPVPIALKNFNDTLQNASKMCDGGLLLSAVCLDKAAECTDISLKMAAGSASVNFRQPGGFALAITTICPLIAEAKTCTNEFKVMCPTGSTKAMQSSDSLVAGLGQMCMFSDDGTADVPTFSCPEKEKECGTITSNLLMKMPQKGRDLSDIGGFCKEVPKAIECNKELVVKCSDVATAASKTVERYTKLEKQLCVASAVSACVTIVDNCVKPFTEDCQHASVESIHNIHKCCGRAQTVLTCLKSSGCPDSMFPLGIKAVFESQFDNLCLGYKDYCPGIDKCFTQMKKQSLYDMCPNVASIFDCVQNVCPDHAKVGEMSLVHMAPLFQDICQGFKDNPELSSCPTYDACSDAAIPPLPGSRPTLQSYASAGDPKHWCRIAKGVSKCSEEVKRNGTCTLDKTFSSHVKSIKQRTATICRGVREPCPTAAKCLSTLFDRGDSSSLITSCPNMPAFVTCVNQELNTCGEESQVKAAYSLTQIGDVFSRSCGLFAANPSLLTCNNAESCFKMLLPKHQAESINIYTDQTYWCPTVRDMLKCVSSVSESCQVSAEVTGNFTQLYNEVLNHCRPTVATKQKQGSNKKYDRDNSGLSVVSSLMLLVISLVGSFNTTQ